MVFQFVLNAEGLKKKWVVLRMMHLAPAHCLIIKDYLADEKKMMEQLQDSKNFKPNPNKKEKSFFDRMKEYFE